MATDLYLIRENGNYAKYDAVVELTLTGAISVYSGVTGVAATNVITATGSALVDGSQVAFTSITGGAGLSANVKYWVVSASGATFKLSINRGGTAIDFTSAITDGMISVQTDEMNAWSSEYRDTFTPVGVPVTGPAAVSGGGGAYKGATVTTMSAATASSLSFGSATHIFSNEFGWVAGTLAASDSDEIAHVPLRQTWLARTMWKFDRGAALAPRYLYAYTLDGDTVADNPPNIA